MSNRDLLRQFTDGTPLDNDAVQKLVDAKLIKNTGVMGALVLTTAGHMLLNGAWLPPGDSASCPDDDSYLPPQHSPGGWIDPQPVKHSALDKQEGGSHYKDHAIQPIEYIHANKLGFIEGNVVKYITRHASKGGAEDVRKVIHYCELLLQLQYGVKP